MNGEDALVSLILGILLGAAITIAVQLIIQVRRSPLTPLQYCFDRALKRVDDLADALDNLSEELHRIKHPQAQQLNKLRYALEKLKGDLLEVALPELLGRRS